MNGTFETHHPSGSYYRWRLKDDLGRTVAVGYEAFEPDDHTTPEDITTAGTPDAPQVLEAER